MFRINIFLTDHVLQNTDISNDRAGGKTGTSTMTEQFPKNKSILKKAKIPQRNPSGLTNVRHLTSIPIVGS